MIYPELKGKHVKGYSIRTERYRYTEWGGGEYGAELYDYQSDPEEYTNLAGDPSQGATLNLMKRLLAEARQHAQ